ncbi:NAD-dependent epimerase/dehydratase family protein [Kineococcus sp. SYSU DK002]|uniref:NAD-dependent epimerase/dehydratase family protein n=1 Tax=Kineococcus sp. SYSU DK002 TaxID=3383123 RepID=UPI003D7E0825
MAACDIVLHVGAVVSPFADDRPELTHRVNVGSIRHIVDAVRALPDPSAVSVVGIGSVARTGDRNPPVQWGRVGDPLAVSHYDEYGQSKIIAEKVLVDSGLPRWTWLRQTGIFHPGILGIRDAITTHSPFAGVMEWVSVEDAARLLVNLCESDVPEQVWGQVFNIGGGEGWRLTNWQLQTRMTAAPGVRDVRAWYERQRFATRNFHGVKPRAANSAVITPRTRSRVVDPRRADGRRPASRAWTGPLLTGTTASGRRRADGLVHPPAGIHGDGLVPRARSIGPGGGPVGPGDDDLRCRALGLVAAGSARSSGAARTPTGTASTPRTPTPPVSSSREGALRSDGSGDGAAPVDDVGAAPSDG